MSSKPRPEGVKNVLGIVTRMREIEPKIIELRKLVDHLKGLEEEYDLLATSMREDLEGMDLEAQGNHGWGGRFGWFLREFHRQAVSGP